MADESVIELRAMMARWTALRARWALEDREEAGLLGYSPLEGPIAEPASWGAAKMEQRMRLLIDLASALDALLIEETRIRDWLRLPLRSVGSRTPLEAMSSSIEWIRALRNAALDFTT